MDSCAPCVATRRCRHLERSVTRSSRQLFTNRALHLNSPKSGSVGARLVGALHVHPHKHHANYSPQKVRGFARETGAPRPIADEPCDFVGTQRLQRPEHHQVKSALQHVSFGGRFISHRRCSSRQFVTSEPSASNGPKATSQRCESESKERQRVDWLWVARHTADGSCGHLYCS
jgi:hypothetical protein